jgi:hypothetical protein
MLWDAILLARLRERVAKGMDGLVWGGILTRSGKQWWSRVESLYSMMVKAKTERLHGRFA